MYIYTIDKDGYITGKKDVGIDCLLSEFDIKGETPYKINHHYQTGIKRPLSQEEINQQRIEELKTIISDKKILDMDCTTEQAELKTLLGY